MEKEEARRKYDAALAAAADAAECHAAEAWRVYAEAEFDADAWETYAPEEKKWKQVYEDAVAEARREYQKSLEEADRRLL
jgi:hypothetical protein